MNSDPKLELPERILLFTKQIPSHESLFVIQNYNFELREILQGKRELLKNLQFQILKEESELKSIGFAVDIKRAEDEKIECQMQKEREIENQLKERLKVAEEERMAWVLECQAEMSKIRSELFSCVGVNEEVVDEEIRELKAKLKLITVEIEEAQLLSEECTKSVQNLLASDIEETIEKILQLRNEMACDNEVEVECEILENEIKDITKNIERL